MSTLEHIGLGGRYGVTKDDPEGNVKAIKEIERILRGGGRLLVTVPYGKKYKVIKPQNRIYDKQSLNKLFGNCEIKDKIVYTQDSQGFWVPMSEEEIREMKEDKEALALSELILRK